MIRPLPRLRFLLPLLGSILLLAAPPRAATADSGWPGDRRVRFLLLGDFVTGTPGADFETALRAATLDDPYSPSAGGEDAGGGWTPQSGGGRTGYGLALGFAVAPGWEARGVVRGEAGLDAMGVRQILYRTNLDLEVSSTRYAAVLYHHPARLPVRLGLGLALTSAEIKARDAWRQFPTNVDSRLGLVVDAGLTWPPDTRLFADAGVQYWRAGEMEYGPYDIRNGIGNIQVYFPRRAYGLDRLTAGVGLGVRL